MEGAFYGQALWGVRVDGPLGRRFLRGLSLTAAMPLRVVVGRAAAERLGSEIGIEDRGALPGNSHPGSVSRQSEGPFMCRLRANFG